MPRLPLLLVVLALATFAFAGTAAADTIEDADTQAARRHFEHGRSLYDAGMYEEACREFTEAKRVLDLPAFDFNLAKCEERLEHWEVALAGYERFLSRVPQDDSAAEVRRRVEVLRARVGSNAPPVPSAPPFVDAQKQRHKLRLAAIGVAVGAGALAAAGFGAYYSKWSSYLSKQSTCTNVMHCEPSDYAALSSRVEHAEIAAGVIWGLAGAAAVADIALWVLSTRHAATSHAWLGVRLGSAVQF